MATVQTGLTAPQITSQDRLCFTIFLALAIHAVVILGITFTFVKPEPATHTMEVTLAQHRSKNHPDKADFLAQFNQTSSGTTEEKLRITSPTSANFRDTEIIETTPAKQPASAPEQAKKKIPVITTFSQSSKSTAVNRSKDTPKLEKHNEEKMTMRELVLEIASKEAEYADQVQVSAKRPRIGRVTSMNSREVRYAFYINSWVRINEQLGTRNLPRDKGELIFGNVRLLVAVLPDGKVKEAKVLESSGKKIIDDTALRIVNIANYPPFNDELRETTDILEIIRTFSFKENSSLRNF